MSLILHIIFYFFKWLDQIYPVCGHSRFRILVFMCIPIFAKNGNLVCTKFRAMV